VRVVERAPVVREFIGGSASERVINPRGGRVGPQSESEYNDNLPQHFGATEDWRAASNARLFDGVGSRNPFEASGGLPRFFDSPRKAGKRKGMFGKGVFG